jgi:hypothetical protein
MEGKVPAGDPGQHDRQPVTVIHDDNPATPQEPRMTSSTETSGRLPDQLALHGIAPRERRIQALAPGTTGGAMSESADSRHQHHAHHADPPQVPSDDRDRARDEARRWVRRKRIFSTIVGVYLALSLMWFVIDMLDDSTGLWFYWPMLGTGLVVVVTGLGMFGLGGLFGADWERRQVERYLERRSDRRGGPDARS